MQEYAAGAVIVALELLCCCYFYNLVRFVQTWWATDRQSGDSPHLSHGNGVPEPLKERQGPWVEQTVLKGPWHARPTTSPVSPVHFKP